MANVLDIEREAGDRRFTWTALLIASCIHVFDLMVGASRPGCGRLDLLLVDAASLSCLAFVLAWGVGVLSLGLADKGRRTCIGLVALAAATAVVYLACHNSAATTRFVIANAIAGFAILGRTFPVGPLDGLFASSPTRSPSYQRN